MRPFIAPLCLMTVLGNPVHAGGAACVMAKFEGKTLDYALVYGTAHPVEAQERVGRDVARKIREFLESGTILDAVNFPSVSREEQAVLPASRCLEQGPVYHLLPVWGSGGSRCRLSSARIPARPC